MVMPRSKDREQERRGDLVAVGFTIRSISSARSSGSRAAVVAVAAGFSTKCLAVEEEAAVAAAMAAHRRSHALTQCKYEEQGDRRTAT